MPQAAIDRIVSHFVSQIIGVVPDCVIYPAYQQWFGYSM